MTITPGRPPIAVALVVVLISCQLARAGGGPAGWGPEAAGRHLDERQRAWSASARCVSCHSGLPYALARPALRKLLGTRAPAEPEARLLARTRLRVANWDKLDTKAFGLYYAATRELKKQSWGTEAVFNAAILAFDDRYRGRTAPSEATKQAFVNVWQTQVQAGDNKGSWNWLDFGEAPWGDKEARYDGAALAAVAVGAAPGYYARGADSGTNARVALLRGYLRDGFPRQSLHNRAWGLWAATQVEGALTKAERKEVIDQLLDKQRGDGGWGLPTLGKWVRGDRTPQEASSDGYATGLVLHVLQTAGVPKGDARVASGLDWLRRSQGAGGGWRSASLVKRRDPASHAGKFMSDAATAYAVLALSH